MRLPFINEKYRTQCTHSVRFWRATAQENEAKKNETFILLDLSYFPFYLTISHRLSIFSSLACLLACCDGTSLLPTIVIIKWLWIYILYLFFLDVLFKFRNERFKTDDLAEKFLSLISWLLFQYATAVYPWMWSSFVIKMWNSGVSLTQRK